jgi:hypothetical protein
MRRQQPTTPHAAIGAIVTIIDDQKKLESHQRSTGASENTIQDSMVYAYDEIVRIIEPFMSPKRVTVAPFQKLLSYVRPAAQWFIKGRT